MNKRLLFFATSLLLIISFSNVLWAQQENDFRSNTASGNWNATGSWQIYNGTDWVAATYYPGQTPNPTANVQIQTGHSITHNVHTTLPAQLVVDGTLIISQQNITIEGQTTINGQLNDNHNNGVTTFAGALVLSGSGTLTSTAVGTHANMVFRNGIVMNSTSASSLGAATFNTNAQTIEFLSNSGSFIFSGSNGIIVNEDLLLTGAGTGILRFQGITIAEGKKVTNNRYTTSWGAINGGGPNAQWINAENATLFHTGTTPAPMETGILNATAINNTVIYGRVGSNDQVVKKTTYHHLHITTGADGRTKRFENVAGTTTVNGDLIIGTNATLGTVAQNTIQRLIVHGRIANNGSLSLQINNNQFCDLEMTGDGTIISGNGTYRIRSLSLVSPNPKTIETSSLIDFYTGNDANTNQILNDGGALTFTNGSVHLRDAFFIRGNGPIAFNNLTAGNNNQTIQSLERNITVNGLLTVNHSNTLSSNLFIGDNTLRLNGGFTRSNSGELGGNENSILHLESNLPTITGSLIFEAGLNRLGSLIHHVSNGATFYNIGAALTIDNLTINGGELRNSSNLTITNSFVNEGIYNQTANTTYFDKTAGSIVLSGNGLHGFWNLEIAGTTQLTTDADLIIRQNFINSSNAASAFLASSGAVRIERDNATQYILGNGSGTVLFHDLIFPIRGTKYLQHDFQVNNLMLIESTALVYLESNARRNLQIHNLTLGANGTGRLLVQDVGTPEHLLTIGGTLTVNAGSTFSMWARATRYADVHFTGSGSLILGNGAFTFRNVRLSHSGEKTFSSSSNVLFRAGSINENTFENSGGSLITHEGEIVFRENDQTYYISGDGAIRFNKLRIGQGTRTNVVLNRSIEVSENLIFQQAAATNYLAINGNTLSLQGNHTRQSNGRIRGGIGSRLHITGSGNFNTGFAFDQTTPGTTDFLTELYYDRETAGTMILSNLMQVQDMQLVKGILNSSSGSIIVHGNANILEATFIDNNNSGYNSFLGHLNVSEDGSFLPTSTSTINFSGSITNNGVFEKNGTGSIFFTGNTTIQGGSEIRVMDAGALITINNGIDVTNTLNTGEGFYTNARINGAGATAAFINQGIFTYHNANEPMATGILNATFNPNIVYYARESNAQNVKGTTYHHLDLQGGGNRTLMELTTINGDLSIGEETIFITQEFQITGNASGKLIMLESSELRIGRDVATNPTFPINFTTLNIELDPISLVSYRGRNQNISNVPEYANILIDNGNTKTLIGNTLVKGYFNIVSGTLAFGTGTARNLTVEGDFIGTGGRLDMSGGSLAHQINLYGISNQVNRFTAADNSIIHYASTADQMVFSPNNGADPLGNVLISGGSVKYMEGPIRINTNLNLQNGIIQIGNHNLILAAAATISGTFSDAAMIETNGTGSLVKLNSGSSTTHPQLRMLYPVGSDGKYTPFNLTSITSSNQNNRSFSVRVVAGRHPSVLPTYDALVRYWVTSTDVTGSSITADFDFTPLDVIGDPAKYKPYRWTGSDFSSIGGTTPVTGNRLQFTGVPGAGEWTGFDNETIRETYYSYKDGPWNDLDTWTTDPSGQLLDGSKIPGNSDNVVILQGRTVYLDTDLNARGLNITINEAGTLDLRDKKFNEVVSVMQGKGTLKLATNAMPLVALNQLVEAEGGTVEYNVPDASFTLNSQSKYNNLTINLPAAGNLAILNNSLNIFGNLYIERGQFQIFRDDASATTHVPVVIKVGGDLSVSESAGIKTGTAKTHNLNGTILPPVGTLPGSLVPRYYDIFHKLYIGGNFTNAGSVRFVNDNINSINFASYATSGAVSVRFYGTNDVKIECNGTTDFYNLIIDKGTGRSAEVELYASQPHHFRLFGANRFPLGTGGANPEVRKALWIRNGTLRLTGSTTIASLAEAYEGQSGNASYIIPANGELVLDGEAVSVLTTADGDNEVMAAWGVASSGVTNQINFSQELYIYGNLTVNEGYISTRFSGGIIFSQAGGELIVNGGKLSTRQIRTGWQGNALLSVNGGEIELLGQYTYVTNTIANLQDIRQAQINFASVTGWRLDGNGTINMGFETNIVNFSGGDINIYNNSGGNNTRILRIMSNASNVNASGGQINIFLRRNTTHNIETPWCNLPTVNIHRETGSGSVRILRDIRINGDLNLTGNAVFDAHPNSYNVSVAGNFNLANGTSYNPRQNITSFFGETPSAFQINGSIIGDLYSLHVNKPNSTMSLQGANANVITRNELQIQQGTLLDQGNTITVMGNILNSGTHEGSGKILISQASGARSIGGNGQGIFGNVEYNEPAALSTSLTADQTIAGTFTLTSGVMDLGNHKLSLLGSLIPANPAEYNEERMFRTPGENSDKGLAINLDQNKPYLFPLGTNANGLNRYTPVWAEITGLTTSGILQINPVAKELPTLNQESTEPALQFYWRVRLDDFTSLPQVAYTFTYNATDVAIEADDDQYYKPGKVVGAIRSFEPSGVNTTLKTISFPAHELLTGSYTAAHEERFDGTVPVFYSSLPNADWYSHFWNNAANWSNVSHDPAAPAASRYPQAGDIVYIGYWDFGTGNRLHSMNIPNGFTAECAELIILKNPAAGTGSSRLVLRESSSANFEILRGIGTFQMNMNASNIPVINSDMGDFLEQTNNLFIYQMVGNGTMHVPDYITTYPNLRFEASHNPNLANRTAVINTDVKVLGNLTIDWGARMELGNAPLGIFSVDGTTFIGSTGGSVTSGSLQFSPSTEWSFETAQLVFHGNAFNQVVVNNSTDGLLHTLRITGPGIEMANGTLDLFNDNSGGNNARLVFSGTNNAAFNRSGGSIPDLHSLVVNKGSDQSATLAINTNFTLGAPSDQASKPLLLQNGTLTLNHADLNLVLSTGGGFFQIPTTSALILSAGTLSINTNNTGINLQGRLRLQGNGQMLLGQGANDNRITLQYQGANGLLEIADNARLEINTQLRRPTNTLVGALKYRQSGGELLIHGRNQVYARAKFEIANAGSEFTMSGGSLIIRRGSGTTFGDLWIEPATHNVSGGTIEISQGSINANQTYRINSTAPLNTLRLGGNVANNRRATVNLMGKPLVVTHLLEMFNNLTTFNTNNNNVTFNKDLIFNGIWQHGASDTTAFVGAVNYLTGSPAFNHCRVNTSYMLLNPASQLTVNGSLVVEQGTLEDGQNAIIVRRDVVNHGTLLSTNPANVNTGLKMRGTTAQRLSGTGNFGLLEIDNLLGVTIQNNLSLQQNLILSKGMLNIGSYMLSLGLNSQILSGTAFSAENMILSDGVAGNNAGLRKTIPSGASSFVFPIGVYGKYTPMELSVAANSSQGSILVKPVNTRHISVNDPDNVLQYWWRVESSGINSFNGEATFSYLQSDVRGNDQDYLAARLIGDNWSKFPNADPLIYVDAMANTIKFYFSGENNITGDFTAGRDDAFSETILTFTSTQSGSWTDLNIWQRSDGLPVINFPNGARVHIQSGHTVATSGNRRQAYTVTIDGKLDIGTTFGHNFGTVDGIGTLSMESNTLPAGRFDSFFSIAGGTMEYGGTGINGTYTISNRYHQFRNLTIKGNGVKTLPSNLQPNLNIIIHNDLRIEDEATLQSRIDQYIYVRGNIHKSPNAKLNLDYLRQRVILDGNQSQNITGNLQGAGNRFNNLFIDNPSGVVFQNSAEVRTFLWLQNGIVTINANDSLVLSNVTGLSTSSFSANNFIDGKLTRFVTNGTTQALFPLGHNGKVRVFALRSPNQGGDRYWSVRYFDNSPLENLGAQVNYAAEAPGFGAYGGVSSYGYWQVNGPTATARVELSWGTEDAITNRDFLVVSEWAANNPVWQNRGQLSTSGTNANGRIISQNVSFSTKYFALGTVFIPTQPLPIELLEFKATLNRDEVHLMWITASETNNHFFTIERSRDGINWQKIKDYPSKAPFGNSNQRIDYFAVDPAPFTGINYYRLKQTDYDGSYTYSEMVGVLYQQQTTINFSLFPNPNRGEDFNIALQGLQPDERVQLLVTDLFGRPVYTISLQANDNGQLNRTIQPPGRLPAGVYLINILGTSGKFNVRMVVR